VILVQIPKGTWILALNGFVESLFAGEWFFVGFACLKPVAHGGGVKDRFEAPTSRIMAAE